MVLEDDEGMQKKIQVVSFSAGRVLDAGTVERANLAVSQKAAYIPTEIAKTFIASLIRELDTVKKQASSTNH